MLDTTVLRTAYDLLLEAASTAAEAPHLRTPPPGEWDAGRILAHVCLVTAGTIATVATVASGEHATYDNRHALDAWSIDRVVDRAGGLSGLRDRLRSQAEILCAFGGSALSAPELDTPVPLLGLSAGALLADTVVPLRGLFGGLSDVEIPTHTSQLLALIPDRTAV
ncbi:hypothetical protein [Nocardia sp. NPDC057668]|uniref:hypothetical protein n=1 Tax=Nocardia sp. NPDC057668 TaxID=3346202 RepID=UPI00366C3476